MEEAGCNAILSLQSDLCLEALQIPYPAIRAQAIGRGMVATRVAVRDFDHQDQAFGLPEAVRTLYTLLSMGKKVYVHCTAGINRATLTVVGYVRSRCIDFVLYHAAKRFTLLSCLTRSQYSAGT